MGAGREDRGRSGRKAERGGAPVADARYLPFGEERREEVDLPSDRGITNQRKEDFGLMDYNARYYD